MYTLFDVDHCTIIYIFPMLDQKLSTFGLPPGNFINKYTNRMYIELTTALAYLAVLD